MTLTVLAYLEWKTALLLLMKVDATLERPSMKDHVWTYALLNLNLNITG